MKIHLPISLFSVLTIIISFIDNLKIDRLMNMNKIFLLILATLVVIFVGGYILNQDKILTASTTSFDANTKRFGNGQVIVQKEMGNVSKENCLSDDCLAIQDLEYPAGTISQEAATALNTAIQDEYMAHATYQKVIENFGMVRPFSMIIRAEENHISSLKSLFDKYSLQIPEDMWSSKVSAPNTIKEACQVGVDAEIANAKLYRDELLPSVVQYEDITAVFTNLMNASQQKHLVAFEKCN